MRRSWRGAGWVEMVPGSAGVLLGVALALSTFGVTRWVGVAVALLGLALLWAGVQRLRFGTGGGGPGLVAVDERRLAYMGPFGGGLIELGDLDRLDLHPPGPDGQPAAWVLSARGGERLAVPVSAEGAERLLDAFAALPGLSVQALLAAREDAREGGPPVAVWRAPPRLR